MYNSGDLRGLVMKMYDSRGLHGRVMKMYDSRGLRGRVMRTGVLYYKVSEFQTASVRILFGRAEDRWPLLRYIA